MKARWKKKESLDLTTHSDDLYCPKLDINNLHAISETGKMAICLGCGEVIWREKEIKFRKKLAKANNINRFKAWFEGKIPQ